jgi:hypothetical protein
MSPFRTYTLPVRRTQLRAADGFAFASDEIPKTD